MRASIILMTIMALYDFDASTCQLLRCIMPKVHVSYRCRVCHFLTRCLIRTFSLWLRACPTVYYLYYYVVHSIDLFWYFFCFFVVVCNSLILRESLNENESDLYGSAGNEFLLLFDCMRFLHWLYYYCCVKLEVWERKCFYGCFDHKVN